MSDYIEREAAIKIQCMDCGNYGFCDNDCSAVESIKRVPAADVRPVVRGRWKLATYSGKYGNAKEKWYDQFFDGAFWYCDQCRERARKSNFCPNCGADMREES